jgi:ubiquitin carboxyl-terminal hydrolase 5/13
LKSIDIAIQFPKNNVIQFDKYLSLGQQPGEEILPEEQSASSQEPLFNQGDIDQLKAMGFSENRCKRALMNTGHQGADIAMSWMFEHMEDPSKTNNEHSIKNCILTCIHLKDIDDPLPSTNTTATTAGPSEDQSSTLQEMGFSAAQAKKALRETVKYYLCN